MSGYRELSCTRSKIKYFQTRKNLPIPQYFDHVTGISQGSILHYFSNFGSKCHRQGKGQLVDSAIRIVKEPISERALQYIFKTVYHINGVLSRGMIDFF